MLGGRAAKNENSVALYSPSHIDAVNKAAIFTLLIIVLISGSGVNRERIFYQLLGGAIDVGIRAILPMNC